MPTLLRAPTRPYFTPIIDAARWEAFRPRDGDIVVATYPKCGTTWTQRIVDLLIHQSPAPRPLMDSYPWIDATFFASNEENMATIEAQTHRRSVKTHLPFDSLPIYSGMKYIHVARDGRDACISMHNHQLGFTRAARMAVGEQAAARGFTGPLPPPIPEDPREFYLMWIGMAEAEDRGEPVPDLNYFDYEMTYWRRRHDPNLLLVHYSDLKADLPGEMQRISGFLDIDTPEAVLAELAKAATFEGMKADGEALLSSLHRFFDRGPDRFLNKGFNGRWKDVLTADDLARYQALAERKLSPDARAWTEGGRSVAGDPVTLAD